MYVLINCDAMRFVARGDYRALAAQADAKMPEASYLIGPADQPSTYRDFTEAELKLLYDNTMEGVPPIPGAPKPTKWELPKLCLALATNAPLTGFKVPLESQHAAYQPPVDEQDARWTPPAPKATLRPKAGTATAKVWEIADAQRAADPTADFNGKEFRVAVVTLCEKEGINSSTAQVQLSKWRKEQ